METSTRDSRYFTAICVFFFPRSLPLHHKRCVLRTRGDLLISVCLVHWYRLVSLYRRIKFACSEDRLPEKSFQSLTAHAVPLPHQVMRLQYLGPCVCVCVLLFSTSEWRLLVSSVNSNFEMDFVRRKLSILYYC